MEIHSEEETVWVQVHFLPCPESHQPSNRKEKLWTHLECLMLPNVKWSIVVRLLPQFVLLAVTVGLPEQSRIARRLFNVDDDNGSKLWVVAVFLKWGYVYPHGVRRGTTGGT